MASVPYSVRSIIPAFLLTFGYTLNPPHLQIRNALGSCIRCICNEVGPNFSTYLLLLTSIHTSTTITKQNSKDLLAFTPIAYPSFLHTDTHTHTYAHVHTHTYTHPCLHTKITHIHTHIGDDLQRQLGSLPVVRPSKVFRIFITRMTSDCLLGLPGLMCSIGAARARGHVTTDIPVHIYGPEGIADFLCTVFKVGLLVHAARLHCTTS